MSDATIAAGVPAEVSQDEKAYAGLAHALMISTWWIGPLIIYLIRRESRFVSFHALQALFWRIVFTVLNIMGMVVFFAVMLSSVLSASHGNAPQSDSPPVLLFIMFPIFWLVMMGGYAISMTLGIVYCLKAMRGEWAGYPLIGSWARRIIGA